MSAHITKNGREHRIPLGAITKEILDTIPVQVDLLLPARGKTETPFSGWSKPKRGFDSPQGLRPWTLHDLRRTYATKLVELAALIHVVEKLLNHISGTVSGVAAVYIRHGYWEEMVDVSSSFDRWLATFTKSHPNHFP